MSNYNSQLQSNNIDLQTVLQTLQTKAVQETPIISVNTSGLITATAGAKSSTHQLAFQPAKTITPSTASQIAVSSGYYTGGNITVIGDSNLVADNIKSGVSIFGVSGNYVGSGGDTSMEDGFITGTISTYTNNRVTTIGTSIFRNCSNITTVSFQKVVTIGSNAFAHCTNLTTVSFPMATTIGSSAFNFCSSLTIASFPKAVTINPFAFYPCSNLTTVSFPMATTIGYSAFGGCSKLTTVDFPMATTIGYSAFFRCRSLTTARFSKRVNIGYSAFTSCYNLKSLYLTGSSICGLTDSDAFSSTPIGGYSASAGTYGSIYVPASLLTSYQTATNWTYFSSRFVAFVDMIAFTLNGTEYQAEEGMTWTEWAESTYNTTEFIEYDGYIVQVQINPFGEYEIIRYITYDDLSPVPANDIINAGYNYRID